MPASVRASSLSAAVREALTVGCRAKAVLGSGVLNRCGELDRLAYAFGSATLPESTRPFPSRDRGGVAMGLRPTKTDKGASGRCRGIDNWDRTFNSVVSARIHETVTHPVTAATPELLWYGHRVPN